MKLFDRLEEEYRCDAPNIIGDEENTLLFDALLDVPLAVRCCWRSVLGEKRFLLWMPQTNEERKRLLEESHPKMERLLYVVGEHFRGAFGVLWKGVHVSRCRL